LFELEEEERRKKKKRRRKSRTDDCDFQISNVCRKEKPIITETSQILRLFTRRQTGLNFRYPPTPAPTNYTLHQLTEALALLTSTTKTLFGSGLAAALPRRPRHSRTGDLQEPEQHHQWWRVEVTATTHIV
jgi:hypothetical protein